MLLQVRFLFADFFCADFFRNLLDKFPKGLYPFVPGKAAADRYGFVGFFLLAYYQHIGDFFQAAFADFIAYFLDRKSVV